MARMQEVERTRKLSVASDERPQAAEAGAGASDEPAGAATGADLRPS